MRFPDFLAFIQKDMRMPHVYQPVMILTLLDHGGQASVDDIARALLNEDRSQLEYYAAITKNMVGQVLDARGVAERHGSTFRLLDFETFADQEIAQLRADCRERLGAYIADRGVAI